MVCSLRARYTGTKAAVWLFVPALTIIPLGLASGIPTRRFLRAQV